MPQSQLKLSPAETALDLPGFSQRRLSRVELLQEQIERLKGRLRLAVIFGGSSNAAGTVINATLHTRPWKSYEAVAEDIAGALTRLGFRHVELLAEDMHLGERLLQGKTHLAWLNTGGVQGYNPVCHAPATLEMLGIPYVGHDPLASSLLDNKHILKRALISLGIPTSPFVVWHPARGPFRPKVSGQFIRVFGRHGGAFVVKPVCGRASLHVHVVDHEDDLPAAVAEVYRQTENQVLIEAYLPGREFCIATSGLVTAQGRRLRRWGEPFTFGAVERILDPGDRIFTSMDLRRITSDRLHKLEPAADAGVIARLNELAHEVFVELNLETLIRLDVRADAAGNLFVLEANPKPDLKQPTAEWTSLVCAGLPDCAMDYDDLILSLLADRLDLLFSQRRGVATQISALLDRDRGAA